MKIIAFVEDYKAVKKILDYLGIYEFEKKRPPPKIDASPDEFYEYIRDDYIDCDHVCYDGGYRDGRIFGCYKTDLDMVFFISFYALCISRSNTMISDAFRIR